jgi:hypothetical protein
MQKNFIFLSKNSQKYKNSVAFFFVLMYNKM